MSAGRVTANAVLLAGYINGSMMRSQDPFYQIVDVDSTTASQTLRHHQTGNLYRVSVVQIDGPEFAAGSS